SVACRAARSHQSNHRSRPPGAAQVAFWPMHDLLFEHQDALRPADLVGYADQLGLDVERFKHHLREHTGAHRVAEDVEGAASAASPAPRPSSSTGAATTAPTTSPPSWTAYAGAR